MARDLGFTEPDQPEEDPWTIHLNIPVSTDEPFLVRVTPPPQHRVKIFPDYDDGTREEIERRLNDGRT